MAETNCNCPYEREIERIIRIIDGNGQEGLVRDTKEIRTKMNTMCNDIKTLCETSEAQRLAISAFNQYQNSQEILTDYKREHRREKRQWLTLIISQSIAVVGLIVTVVLTLIELKGGG